MFGKYNGFVSKARVSACACMYFLVFIYICAEYYAFDKTVIRVWKFVQIESTVSRSRK
jgi:hypothetical protein